MKVGFVGLGKLGLPVALVIESKGHTVVGHDINPEVKEYIIKRQIPFVEKDIEPYLKKTKLKVLPDIYSVVEESDIVFLPVQTPHDKEYEGSTRIPNTRKDFDYTYLKQAIVEVSMACEVLRKKTIIAVISTCLPGTFQKEIKQLLNDYVSYVYTPQFIAMGTVIDDYLNPEFNLIGVDDPEAAKTLEAFYKTINDAPMMTTDITTAEAIKVSYNTFITMKTVLANTWGEIAYKVGANVDDIFKAWSMSTKRLLSTRYLQAGVGDGGGCHPRDNIALSYIAEEIGLSHNLFEDLMKSREQHMDFIAHLAIDEAHEAELPIVILGRSFKPETNIETGSPAILLANLIEEKGFDVTHVENMVELKPAVYVIGTKHARYATYAFPDKAVVIDPFGYIPDRKGITTIRIGR